MEFLNSNPQVKIEGLEKQKEYYNYYLHQCPDGITDVPVFLKVLYKDLYEGIDLLVYSKNGNIEYDFIVHPGADPNQIKFEIRGTDENRINEKESLIAQNIISKIEHLKPYTYQDDKEISSSFYKDSNLFSFELGEYDKSKKLIIDPILKWSTFNGGSSYDYNICVDTDTNLNIFTCGLTQSINFITTAGAFQINKSEKYDFFVQRFSKDGDLIWSTYYGADSNDYVRNLYVRNGKILLTGWSASEFPVTPDAYQKKISGPMAGFYVLLDYNGKRNYATVFGDNGVAISDGVIDSKGNIFIVGHATGLIVTTPDAEYNSRNMDTTFDGIIAKFNSKNELVYSSYLPGGKQNYISSLDIDKSDELIISGETDSTDLYFSKITNPFNHFKKLYIAKHSNDGKFKWGLFFGYAQFSDAVFDNNNNIIVKLYTNDNGLIVKNPFQDSIAGYFDAYIAHLKSNGDLNWATYLGGMNDDGSSSLFSFHNLHGLRSNSKGDILIGGTTESNNFPITENSCTFYNKKNCFISIFDSTGKLKFSTVFGGNDYDYLNDATFLTDSNIISVGLTNSENFPNYGNSIQKHKNGLSDGFLLLYEKLSEIYLDTLDLGEVCLNQHNEKLIYLNKIKKLIELGPELKEIKLLLSKDFKISKLPILPIRIDSLKSIEVVIKIYPTKPEIVIDTLELEISNIFCDFKVAIPLSAHVVEPPLVKLDKIHLGDVCANSDFQKTIHLNELTELTSIKPQLQSLDFQINKEFKVNGYSPVPAVIVKEKELNVDIGFHASTKGYHIDTLELELYQEPCTFKAKLPVSANVIQGKKPTIEGPLKICKGDTALLSVKENFLSYEWSTGATTKSVVVSQRGRYIVTTTDSMGCEGKDTFDLEYYDSKIEILGNVPFCRNDSIDIYVQGNYRNIKWSTGDTTSKITINKAGSYSVTAVDSLGCFVQNSITAVYYNPVSITADGYNPVCPGDSVTLRLTQKFIRYEWSTGETTPTIRVPAGYYSCYAVDEKGCDGTSDITIYEVDPNSIKIKGNKEVCIGNEEGYNIAFDKGKITWNIKNGNIVSKFSDNVIKVKWTAKGEGFVVVKVDYFKCSFTDTIAVNVHDAGTIDIVQHPSEYCEGDTVTLTVEPDMASYLWSTGDTTKSITLTSTNKELTVTVTDSIGCTATKKKPVVFDKIPSVNIIGTNKLCAGETATYNLTGSIGIISYDVINGEIVKGDSTRTIDVQWSLDATSGRIIATVETEIAKCSGSDTLDVELLKAPHPKLQADKLLICEKGEATITVPSGYAEYRWSNGVTGTEKITVNKSGDYHVRVKENDGCWGSSDTVHVTISEPPQPIIIGDELICAGLGS